MLNVSSALGVFDADCSHTRPTRSPAIAPGFPISGGSHAPFTIESTNRIPVYRQRTYEADTVEQACRLAIEDDDWSDQKEDYESSGETYVTGRLAG